MDSQHQGGMNRRQSLKALVAGGAALLSPIRLTHAQGAIEAGKPLPPILMESYPDQMSVEVVRLYARELAEIGIQINHKPLGFAQILGQVYGRKEFTTALMGFGSPEERLDPDYYLRSVFASDSSFNFTGYKNAEFDNLCKLQQEEPDWKKRQEAIFQAQRVWAQDMPSWHVCSRAAINPVNKRLFRNFKPSRALGLEVYHVAPYLALEPVGALREVNVASTFRMSSAHILTERSANGRGYLRFLYDSFLRFDGDLNLMPWAAESYAVDGYNSHPIEDFLLPYSQTARMCGMRFLPPLLLHGTHRASEAEVARHAEAFVDSLARYRADSAAVSQPEIPLDARPALFSSLKAQP